MTEFDPTRARDPLAERMCRGSDAARLATVMIHFLVVCAVAVGAMWTLAGIRNLREDNDRWESELIEFQRLAATAARSPRRDAARVADQFGRRIAEQTWHSNLEGVRPRVLQTPSGLRVRFARTIPTFGEGRLR